MEFRENLPYDSNSDPKVVPGIPDTPKFAYLVMSADSICSERAAVKLSAEHTIPFNANTGRHRGYIDLKV